MEFDSVLCTVSGDAVKVGKQYVTGVTVKATVEGHEKGDKVRVYNYKRRKSIAERADTASSTTQLRVSEISGL